MDGLELLARIHELRPGTPTLLITGHGDQDLEIRALRGGAFYYILKPIDRDYFVAALRRAIQAPLLQRQVAEHKNATPGSPITVKLQYTGQKAIITLSYTGEPPGLGLEFYASRKIVEQHAGRLEVQSHPENRTAYFLMLPRRIDPIEEQTDTIEHAQRTQALWTVTT